MALFNKKKKVPVAELKIQELHTKPYEQIMSLQKRFDHIQDLQINTSTHLGELKLNAEGDIRRIELSMGGIQDEMTAIKQGIEFLDQNINVLITKLNLTSKKEELDRFNNDLDRLKLFNLITVKQFGKMLKDAIRKTSI